MEKNNGVNSPSLATQLLARYRQTAQKFGPYFGQQIFTVISTNPDLRWKEDTIAGMNTLRQEVKVFLIKAIDVKSVKFLEEDLDGNPKIVLNEESNDPNLVFPLTEPDFSKATRATVKDCVDRLSKLNSKPMFFAAEELPMLNDLLKISNQSALTFFEDQSRKNMKLAECVRDIMDSSDRTQTEYLRQCGVNPNVDTTIRVQVTEVE